MRPAQPHDASAIARVHVATWRVGYAHVFPEERLQGISVDARADRWRDLLTEPRDGEYTAVAEVDGEIVGFATAGPDRDGPGVEPRP